MTCLELTQILKLHEKWLNGEEGGKRAVFRNEDLSGLNLTGVNLRKAIFENVNLSRVNFSNANLSETNLKGINLSEANLTEVDLTDADLYKADLSQAILYHAILKYTDLRLANLYKADLSCADLENAFLIEANLCKAVLNRAILYQANLQKADLTYANISGVDLRKSNLYEAKLNNIVYNETTTGFFLVCPEKGSYIGYKTAHGFIVELLIPEDAKRSSATTRKCRASKAKVLNITNLDGSPAEIQSITSDFDKNFFYTIGKTVEVKDFTENRWIECGTGIHHFITRSEAVAYTLA